MNVIRAREDHQTDFAAIMTADDHIHHQPAQCLQRIKPQLARLHPCAGQKFEIFGHTAIKHQPPVHILWVEKFDRIAGDEKSFVIKGFGGFVGIVEIAGHDIRAFDPDFTAHVGVRDEFDLNPRQSHANDARTTDGFVDHDVGGRGLGQAPA